MLPPTLASKGGSGLSLSFLKPLRLGLLELANKRNTRDSTNKQLYNNVSYISTI